MSEEDLTGLATVVNALSDSLESSMASAITEPIAGWVGTFLGFGQGGDDEALSTITQNLADLISDVHQLQIDLSAQLQAIGTQIQATAVLPAVTAVQAYQYSGDLPFDTLWTIQTDRNAVHDTLVGDVVADGDSADSGPGYLMNVMAPLRYACDTSPQQEGIVKFFVYFQKIQAVLMQMMVEAAHQGQLAPLPSPMPANPFPGVTAGWPPPNYEQAALAYARYQQNIAEQSTFLPFSTAGIACSPYPNGIGANRIIYDRTANITWCWQNFANPYSGAGMIGVPTGGNILSLTTLLSATDRWKLRLPTFAEIDALYKSLTDPAGNPVTSETVVAAMTNLGFYVTLPAVGAGFLPFATSEVLQSSNWHLLGSTGNPRGYRCQFFYDLLNGLAVQLQIYCPVSRSSFTPGTSYSDSGTAVVNDGMFTDIQSATSMAWSDTNGEFSGSLPTVGYCDFLWVYRLANADAASGVSTDPPVEEPASITISSVDQGNITQFTASSIFQRFDRTAAAYVPLSLDLPVVYWSVDSPDLATINQSGTLTWLGSGEVNVTAVRGPISAQVMASTPAGYVATPPTPAKLNIYPRNQTIGHTSLPLATPFNGQILWSDGRTSTFGDADANPTTHFPNGDPVPPFTFAIAGSTPLTVDSPAGTTLTIPAIDSGTFTVTLSVNGNPQLTDHATIRVT